MLATSWQCPQTATSGGVSVKQRNMAVSPARLGTQEGLRWRGPAEIVNYRFVVSSERALHINKSVDV
jgi:hypothetical protein